MSSYISIYEKITKAMNIVELIYLTTIKKKETIIKNYPSSIFVIGPYVYRKLLKSKQTRAFCAEQGFEIFICECKKFLHDLNFKIIFKIESINERPQYDRFIMDVNHNIFTTPTGLIMLKYYYLDEGIVFKEGCFKDYLDAKTLHRDAFDILAKKDIRAAFQIKKKYKMPRFVIYLIIIEICKLHFKNSAKYICKNCDHPTFNEYCSECEDEFCCVFCNSENNLLNCDKCGDLICDDCTCSSIGRYCFDCTNSI